MVEHAFTEMLIAQIQPKKFPLRGFIPAWKSACISSKCPKHSKKNTNTPHTILFWKHPRSHQQTQHLNWKQHFIDFIIIITFMKFITKTDACIDSFVTLTNPAMCTHSLITLCHCVVLHTNFTHGNVFPTSLQNLLIGESLAYWHEEWILACFLNEIHKN